MKDYLPVPVLTSYGGRNLAIKLLINTHKEPAIVGMGTKPGHQEITTPSLLVNISCWAQTNRNFFIIFCADRTGNGENQDGYEVLRFTWWEYFITML